MEPTGDQVKLASDLENKMYASKYQIQSKNNFYDRATSAAFS